MVKARVFEAKKARKVTNAPPSLAETAVMPSCISPTREWQSMRKTTRMNMIGSSRPRPTILRNLSSLSLIVGEETGTAGFGRPRVGAGTCKARVAGEGATGAGCVLAGAVEIAGTGSGAKARGAGEATTGTATVEGSGAGTWTCGIGTAGAGAIDELIMVDGGVGTWDALLVDVGIGACGVGVTGTGAEWGTSVGFFDM